MFGIQKRYFHGNARIDRCLGSNNSSVVILTGVSTVTKKGSLRSNGRRYNKGLHSKETVTRVEAGSNTSTVTLRVIGGDEKGSLKPETVKYGLESQGLGPEKDCAGKKQHHI
jgi:hypothetical protein